MFLARKLAQLAQTIIIVLAPYRTQSGPEVQRHMHSAAPYSAVHINSESRSLPVDANVFT